MYACSYIYALVTALNKHRIDIIKLAMYIDAGYVASSHDV